MAQGGSKDGGEDDAAAYRARLDEVTIGGAQPLRGKLELHAYDPDWPARYAHEAAWVTRALGDRVLRIAHVGSTAVPGLPAKPTIDMILEVAASADESAYLPPLERAGYALAIREPAWFEHRLLYSPREPLNLHVFSAGCPEIERMIRFRDWLRGHADDRDRYAAVKRSLAARDWELVQQYADAKTEIVAEIMARAIADLLTR